MGGFSQFTQALREARLLGILRAPTSGCAVEAALAAFRGGLRIIEIAFTTPEAPAALRALKTRLEDHALLGAGTIMKTAEAEAAIGAGAQFLVSPHLGEKVLEVAHSHGVPYIPGVLTPTEVARALGLGVEVVKLFPIGSAGGTRYLRDLLGPFPGLSALVTGGINPQEAPNYLKAGALAVGLGSTLFPKAALEAGDWTAVEAATLSALRLAGPA